MTEKRPNSFSLIFEGQEIERLLELCYRHIAEKPNDSDDIVITANYLRSVLMDHGHTRRNVVLVSPKHETAFESASDELLDACLMHGPLSSLHEGYAVLLEELEEFWDEVKINQKYRSLAKLKKEISQVAAVALRIFSDLCTEDGIRK